MDPKPTKDMIVIITQNNSDNIDIENNINKVPRMDGIESISDANTIDLYKEIRNKGLKEERAISLVIKEYLE